jgi:hypothetical protein
MVERASDGHHVLANGAFAGKWARTQGLQFPPLSTPELYLIQRASLHAGRHFFGSNLQRTNAPGLEVDQPSIKD